MPVRFHLPTLPNRPVSPEHSVCAYSGKIRRFKAMMEPRGHEVTIYGAEGADVSCPDDASLIAAISERSEPRDVLGIIGGTDQAHISEALPHLLTVEYGVGYLGTFSRFRVFESHAWRHVVAGAQMAHPMADWGSFYDAVIPNYFDPAEFPVGQGGDYLLYVGRMIEGKGVYVAAEVAEAAGMELIYAGPGECVPDYGEHIGPVGPERRAELMGGARALLCPTLYHEPFGGVAVEAQMCGTPVLATEWGAFTETVEQGTSGYRCRTLGEFVAATERVSGLDREHIARRARERYSLDAVAPLYESYFDAVAGLYEPGVGDWMTHDPGRFAREEPHA